MPTATDAAQCLKRNLEAIRPHVRGAWFVSPDDKLKDAGENFVREPVNWRLIVAKYEEA